MQETITMYIEDYGAAPLASRAEARKQLRDLIARACTLLDELDGDPDFEEQHDEEESLGWEGGRSHVWANNLDREEDAADDCEPDADLEEVNEDGGDVCDGPHDVEDEDTGIGDGAGVDEQRSCNLYTIDSEQNKRTAAMMERGRVEALGNLVKLTGRRYCDRKSLKVISGGYVWGRVQ